MSILTLEYIQQIPQNDLLTDVERKEAIAFLDKRSDSFSLLSLKARSDKEIAMIGVNIFSWNILSCSDSLQLDRELIEIAILKEPKILQHLSKSLKKNLTFATHILMKELENIKILRFNLKKNRGTNSSAKSEFFISSPIYQEKYPLKSTFQFFQRSVRNNLKIATIAISVDYRNYEFIGPKLKENVTFALFALSINPRVYYLLNDKLKNNSSICEKVVLIQGDFIDVIPKKLVTNELVVHAIEQNHLNTFLVEPHFFLYKDVALSSVKNNGIFLKELPLTMRNDFDVVYSAITSSLIAIDFIGLSFQHYVQYYKKEHQPNTNIQTWHNFPEFFRTQFHQERLEKLLTTKSKER